MKNIKILVFISFAIFSLLFLTKNKQSLAYFYIKAGEICCYLGGYNKAEDFYFSAVQKLQNNHSSRLKLINNLRQLAWQRTYINFEYEKGIAALKKAMLIAEPFSDEMAELYSELGESLNYAGDYKSSFINLSHSFDLYRLLNKKDKQFAIALKMAIYYAEQSSWEQAEGQLIRAINFREGVPEESKTCCTLTEMSLVMGKLVLHIVKNKEKAFEYHLAACKHAKNSTIKKQVHAQIALGSYYESSDQFEEAIHKYRYALELCTYDMEREEDYIRHTIQGCLRKFSMNPAN